MKELVERQIPKKAVAGSRQFRDDTPVYEYDLGISAQWKTEARTALYAAFPQNHPVTKQWDDVVEKIKRNDTAEWAIDELRAVFKGAYELVNSGRISTIVDGIRNETEGELIDQALELQSKDYLVAATVLAGGALETHLRYLCEKHSIAWTGSGSISSYNDAISRERKAGTEIYSGTYSKSVTAWGGLRNDAAHDPTNFSASNRDVETYINGINEFISRTS